MKYDITLTLAGILICIAICLFAILIWGTEQTNNKRWKTLEGTDEWSSSGNSSLGKRLVEKWAKEHPGSIPDKIQGRCNEIANHYIDVASNVRKVSVSKTIGTEAYVIKFTSANGKMASLWLDENGTINSISEY